MKHVSPHRNSGLVVIFFATALIILWGNAAMAMSLNSPAFQQNGHIPSKYTCEAEDVSPPLAWEGTNRADLSIVAESHFWSAPMMEYRGIRYTIRAGIERGQWFVAIHPDEGVEVARNKTLGTREDAEFYAHCMISRWLEPKSRQRINRKR